MTLLHLTAVLCLLMPSKPLPREDSLGLPCLLNHSIICSYLGLQSSSFYRLQPVQVIKYLKPPTPSPFPPCAQHERLSTKLTLWSCGEAFGTKSGPQWTSVRAFSRGDPLQPENSNGAENPINHSAPFIKYHYSSDLARSLECLIK